LNDMKKGEPVSRPRHRSSLLCSPIHEGVIE
jgi:hypothetical protein